MRFAVLIERFEACPSPMSQIVIEHFHGAASRVPVRRPRAPCASPASTSRSSRSGWIRARTIAHRLGSRHLRAEAVSRATRYVNYLDATNPAIRWPLPMGQKITAGCGS